MHFIPLNVLFYLMLLNFLIILECRVSVCFVLFYARQIAPFSAILERHELLKSAVF